jgi:hypothetical protein
MAGLPRQPVFQSHDPISVMDLDRLMLPLQARHSNSMEERCSSSRFFYDGTREDARTSALLRDLPLPGDEGQQKTRLFHIIGGRRVAIEAGGRTMVHVAVTLTTADVAAVTSEAASRKKMAELDQMAAEAADLARTVRWQCATATLSIITVDGDIALCEVRGLVTACALAEIMRHIEGAVEARHLHCFLLYFDRAVVVSGQNGMLQAELLWPDDGVRPLMPGVLLVAEIDAPWVREHCFAMGSRGYLRAAFTDRMEARMKCNTFARIHEEFEGMH